MLTSHHLRTPGRSGRADRGFTLIEVLVVVGIIALLLTILLPSLKAARGQAQATICATHLDEIFKGVFMYTQANQDRLPHLGYRSDTNRIRWMWFTQISPLVRNQYGIFTCAGDHNPEKHSVYL